ncbi:MAG: carbamoyltransferase [Acidobacteria bacterium]|nr:carbamoyltransferase [Acidobacteriota bacterium]
MIILGLHKDPWHNSGAAIIREDGDGPRFAYVAEERLDRVKDSRAFPELSTQACMRELGVGGIEQIDLVVLDYIRDGSDWRRDHFRTPCRTETFLARIPANRITIANHHLMHAYATFCSSRFESAAVLIVDGRGSDNETQSLFLASPEGIKLVARTDRIGIGLLYAAVTHAIGFGLLQEGKTMGLAPYGARTQPSVFDFRPVFDGIRTDYSAFCADGRYDIIAPHRPLKTFDDKARAAWEVQEECERAMLHLARYTKEKTGARYLCLSGGVALNSVANNVLLSSGLFEDIFINPAASDTGIPLGAALYGYHHLKRQPRRYREISAFLGPSYSTGDIEKAIARFSGFEVIRQDSFRRASELLAENRILGCFQGRSEMGPRALGNRSILMSPLLEENKDILNARVKRREAFRPFAPACLEEFAQEYFAVDRPSPYMLLVPDVRPEKRGVIPAVTHVDGTARLQTLTRDRNGHFYDLVNAFHGTSGVPVVLNTSFNMAGEPIVETPEDAIRCFLSTEIDALLLGEFLLVKNPLTDHPAQ